MTKRKIIQYNPKLKLLARKLRNNSTKSEVFLWNYLKGKQLKGYDFHRQKPIGNYIVDFFCSELLLAIEIDGESHYGNEEKDLRRQKEIEKYGVCFLRFDESEIYYNLDKVIKSIEDWIEQNTHLMLRIFPSCLPIGKPQEGIFKRTIYHLIVFCII